jgi:hypothetical protein
MTDDDHDDTTNAAGEPKALSESDRAHLRRRGYTVDDDGVHVRHATGHEASPATIAAALIDEKSDDPPPATGNTRDKVLGQLGLSKDAPPSPEPNSAVRPTSLGEVLAAARQYPTPRRVDLRDPAAAASWAGRPLIPGPVAKPTVDGLSPDDPGRIPDLAGGQS